MHTFDDLWTQMTPGVVFVIAALFLFVDYSLWMCSYGCNKDLKLNSTEMKLKLLDKTSKPNFFNVLTPKQRDRWLVEDVTTRQRNDVQILSSETFSRLAHDNLDKKTANLTGAKLRGQSTYDMLMNDQYADKMCYVPCWYPLRSSFALSQSTEEEGKNTSFDIVRMACNLAYMDEARAKNMQFTTQHL
jgi:hypothetical protein